MSRASAKLWHRLTQLAAVERLIVSGDGYPSYAKLQVDGSLFPLPEYHAAWTAALVLRGILTEEERGDRRVLKPTAMGEWWLMLVERDPSGHDSAALWDTLTQLAASGRLVAGGYGVRDYAAVKPDGSLSALPPNYVDWIAALSPVDLLMEEGHDGNVFVVPTEHAGWWLALLDLDPLGFDAVARNMLVSVAATRTTPAPTDELSLVRARRANR